MKKTGKVFIPKIIRILGIFFAAMFVFLFSFPSLADNNDQIINTVPVYVIASAGLNIREKPNSNSEVIKVAPYGTELQLIKLNTKYKNWASILYKGQIRYVSNMYISVKKPVSNTTYLGSYRITFYCACSKCCGKWASGTTASGTVATAGRTIATGREFSFGTKLKIGGTIYTVEDRGVGNGAIDIFCSTHAQAVAGGMYYADVYLVKRDQGPLTDTQGQGVSQPSSIVYYNSQQISSISAASTGPSGQENFGNGDDIVAYANKFVGNPYKYGGNSLTNGIDCSHFVYNVLKNTGYYAGDYVSSSYWANLGRAVASVDQARAGDVIVYKNHVAIYDGKGCIIEASSSATGIINYNSVYKKTILAIRRFT